MCKITFGCLMSLAIVLQPLPLLSQQQNSTQTGPSAKHPTRNNPDVPKQEPDTNNPDIAPQNQPAPGGTGVPKKKSKRRARSTSTSTSASNTSTQH